MIVHESARRGQVLYGQMTPLVPARKRDTGARTNTKDDKGRPVMPFERFVLDRNPMPTGIGNVMDLMKLAFGGR